MAILFSLMSSLVRLERPVKTPKGPTSVIALQAEERRLKIVKGSWLHIGNDVVTQVYLLQQRVRDEFFRG